MTERNPVNDVIAALDGARIPGGCDHCDAYQVVQAHAYGEQNIHMIHVYHDSGCPFIAARRTASSD